MSRGNSLPFERGTTISEGQAEVIAKLDEGTLLGSEWQVNDPDTGELITLIVLKNDKASGTVYPGFGYKPKAGKFNRAVDAYPDAKGFGYVVDPHYRDVGVLEIANGDYFYAIKEGRCNGAKTGANWSDGSPLGFAANGVLSPVTANNQGINVIARAAEGKVHTSAATSGEYALCYIGDHGYFTEVS